MPIGTEGGRTHIAALLAGEVDEGRVQADEGARARRRGTAGAEEQKYRCRIARLLCPPFP